MNARMKIQDPELYEDMKSTYFECEVKGYVSNEDIRTALAKAGLLVTSSAHRLLDPNEGRV